MIKFKDLMEAHKVGDKVTILKGSEKGKEGRIGEIRKGLYKGAPKTFTVDYDHHETTGARKSIQVKAKHIQKIKEDTEMLQEKHRVSITVSDPNNPSVDKRKELIQKTVRIEADNEGHAIDSAIAHYKKAGYKVHDHNYVGTVKEDLEEAMSNAQERGAADKHYGRKYNNPHDKGSQEHSDYHKGYHSTESEKDYGGSKGKPLHKFESTVTESALERFRKAAAEREKEANKREAEMKARHASGKEDMKGAIDTLAKKMNNEETQLDEISQKLAGDYYGAVVKQQAKKTGLKPDLYHKLEPKRQKGIDRATDRLMSKEEVAANNVGGGNIAGTQGDAGKKAVMTKKPLKRQVIQFKEFADAELEEGKNGLWANIHAKRKRIKNGSGERMRKPGSKGAPTDQDFKDAQEDVEVQFDMIEDFIEQLALLNNVDSEQIWEDLESVEDDELLEYAIDKKGHKSSEGGLTQKGVDYYNRKTGGNLQTAVTTPPSKLKPGSKAAKRRKSFCARMGGMKKRLTSAKTANDPDSRINKALRKWNC